MNIEQSYVPEQFYASGNARDTAQQTLLQGNVTNPFNISNFESLRTSNPTLYHGRPAIRSSPPQRSRGSI